jgi:PIN domain
MRTNYVLIDYENVQPTSLVGLDAEHFRVLVFVGASQNKLTFDIAAAVQKLGARAEYIKIAGNGSNALDFHIAFHIGHLSAQDPTAFFHIISKDTGFDPLIQHLKERKVLASRSRDVLDIPLLKVANSKTTPEKIDVVLANLQQRGTSKPRTLKTLTSTINSLFQKQLTEEELIALLKGLQAKGFIAVNETKVTYALPPSEA